MFPGLLTGVLFLAPPAAEASPPNPPGFAATTERKDALARYGAGIWQARRERLLTAAKAFEAAALKDPDATAPRKELIRIYAQIGREPQAIRIARDILAKDPRDAETAHILARLLYEAGELKDAVAAAKVAAEYVDAATAPDKALAVYRDLATLQERLGDAVAAANALRIAVELLTTKRQAVIATGTMTPREVDAEAAETWERLGRVLIKANKYDEATDAFRAAHKLYADPTRVNNPNAAARLDWNLSGALAGKGDPAAALTHLDAFLQLRPQSLEPYERLASVLRQAGRGSEVVPRLRKLTVVDPKNLYLLTVMAVELARDPATRPQADVPFQQIDTDTNDSKILRAIVRSNIETDRPARVILDFDRAYTILKGEDPKEAELRKFAAEKARILAEILRSEPDWASAVLRAAEGDLNSGSKRNSQTWHMLGMLAARHHKLDLAVIQFKQAIVRAPKEVEGDAYGALLDALWQSRRPSDVAAVCRDGLRTAQNVSPVFFNYHLALALAELGDGDEAIATADRAILQAGDANRLVTRLRKASVLKVLGRWEDAVALCTKLLDEFDSPNDRIRIRYMLSGAYWGAKKYREAEAELRSILDVDPDHTGACNDLGYHLADQGRDLDEAEALVRRAMAADRADRRKSGDPEPESAAYVDSLAWVMFRKDKLAEARELLEKAITIPDGAIDAIVWDHLGDVYFRLNEKPKAKTAWMQAEELYRTDRRGKLDGRLEELRRKLKRVQ